VATHDYVISNGTGSAVRSDINGALAAIVSQNSNASEPATMYAYQWWADTTTGLLKIRNAYNSAWVTIGTLASANLGLLPLAGGTMTGVLAVTAGTAALPGIAVSGDTNTGIYSPGADTLAFAEGGAEAMRIDSSGRLLVGTTTARTDYFNNTLTAMLQVEGTKSSGAADRACVSIVNNNNLTVNESPVLVLGRSNGSTVNSKTIVSDGTRCGYISFQGADGSDLIDAASIAGEVDGTPGANDMPGRLVFSTTADGAASPTERMRITSSGEMLLGPNQISTSKTLSVKDIGLWNGGSNTEIGWFGGATPTAALKFNAWWDAGVDRLHITDADYTHGVVLAQNSNAWGAYSDGRLKKDICPIEDSIALLKEIKPCRFAWKSGSQPDIGFIAQELKPILPEAVDGDESEFRQEGDRFYGQMSVKHDKLIPLLTAALQEAIAKIEALETRLSALEAA